MAECSTSTGEKKAKILTMLNFHFNKEVMSLPLYANSSFDDVVSRVKTKWFRARSGTLNCHYDIGSLQNVCLNVESDFEGLMYHIEDFHPRRVEIVVCNDEIADGGSDSAVSVHGISGRVESAVSVHSCNKSVSIQESEEEDWLPHYDTAPREVSHPLLSDSWANNIRSIGQKFLGGSVEFREELVKFAARSGFKYSFIKNNKRGISVYCRQRDVVGCKWKICGSEKMVNGIKGVFVINSGVLLHQCSDVLVKDDAARLTPKMVSSLVLETVKHDPTYTGKGVRDLMSATYGVVLPYGKAWRGLQTTRDKLFGVYKESFNELQWYAKAAEQTNPGTRYKLESDSITKCFTRFFIAFKASLDGFKNCRPMLFIDATSLKGKFKGQLLTAIAKDGNNGLFPVAFAVVDAETIDHWTFFIRMLHEVVQHDQPIFYLSDRHVGIMQAFPAVYGDKAVHYFCLFHLYTNLKGRFSGSWSHAFRRKMVSLLKLCAYAPTKTLFHIHLNEFKEAGGSIAVAFLENLPFDKWAVAYAPNVVRYGEMTSNAAESFNKVVKKIRSLPLKVMMDTIRQLIMGWYKDRRADSGTWKDALCPRKQSLWNAYKDKGRQWQLRDGCDPGVYEVVSDTTQTVNLNNRRCSCFYWQVQGFPCEHAVKVISQVLPHISGTVDPCFFAATYRLAYSHSINPIPTSMRGEMQRSLGDVETILAPPTKATAGRPKRKRVPSFGEVPYKKTKPFTCENCNQLGRHDITTCGAKILEDIQKLHDDFHMPLPESLDEELSD